MALGTNDFLPLGFLLPESRSDGWRRWVVSSVMEEAFLITGRLYRSLSGECLSNFGGLFDY